MLVLDFELLLEVVFISLVPKLIVSYGSFSTLLKTSRYYIKYVIIVENEHRKSF